MKKEKTQLVKLYLDDIRDPKNNGWIVLRSYDEFIDWIDKNGLPDEISLDHDLGDDKTKTGYDVAKWIGQYCWDNGLPIPNWNVHSANPVGRDNITQLLKSYEKKLNH